MWLNYASDKPFGQLAVISLVLVLTSRYFILGIEKGTHLFADVQDVAFAMHGLNETTAPAIRAVRDHVSRRLCMGLARLIIALETP